MISPESARQNRILALLSPAELEPILPTLERRALAAGVVLQPRGQRAEHAVFPLSGVASMVSRSANGDVIEVATVGYEGMTGLSLFLGGDDIVLETFMQVPGNVLCMPAEDFARLSDEPAFRRVANLYLHALITQIAQASACNRLHSVEQRCARWLLQTHDRARADQFELTHEFLGFMLGVRRASVSEVASILQSRGVIRYHRGVITMVDRVGLEQTSCSCYAFIAQAYDRVLADVPNRNVRDG